MDFNQETWDRLNANGHILGRHYIQDGKGLMAVVDDVAMPVHLAKAVADGRLTVKEVTALLDGDRSSEQ